MALAQHLKEASTAPMATDSVGSRVRWEVRRSSSNNCLWNIAASASRAIWCNMKKLHKWGDKNLIIVFPFYISQYHHLIPSLVSWYHQSTYFDGADKFDKKPLVVREVVLHFIKSMWEIVSNTCPTGNLNYKWHRHKHLKSIELARLTYPSKRIEFTGNVHLKMKIGWKCTHPQAI